MTDTIKPRDAIDFQSMGSKAGVPTSNSGVGVIGAATDIALARHMPRASLPRKKRTRRALPSQESLTHEIGPA